MENIIIVGTSSTAENVYAFINKYSLFNVIGFTVNERFLKGKEFCGHPVYPLEKLRDIIDVEKDYLFVAIQWNNLNADRKNVYLDLKTQGFKFANIISPNSIIYGTLTGENCWVADNVIIEYGVVIEDNVFLKSGSWVGHFAHVKKHCFIGARSNIAGNVVIGEQTFVGIGATIFDSVKIGNKCIIGACTAVNRNIDDFCVYKIQAQNFIKKQYPEEEIESKLQFSKSIR